jgi:hypothetical protein
MRRAVLVLVLVLLGCGKEPDPPQNPKPRDDADRRAEAPQDPKPPDNNDMIRRARTDIETLSNAVKLFYVEHGNWPASLEELVTPPSGKPIVKDLKDLFDPWGQHYLMTGGPGPMMGQRGHDVPDVWSMGPPEDHAIIGNWMTIK